ncbi:hypothetical protein [Calycomorphotria hydatis]|uniref:Uncharacterized protein n=1 Tax=Calycomorphotria hydatis TaxID=2528027 RepID=A0A517TB73_9PLAN|nr:hypothetical protein [Calycomorphotria hydatis]QDT65624.1 hypothetical protein V22_28820 [Calycomorphotria hydatis]
MREIYFQSLIILILQVSLLPAGETADDLAKASLNHEQSLEKAKIEFQEKTRSIDKAYIERLHELLKQAAENSEIDQIEVISAKIKHQEQLLQTSNTEDSVARKKHLISALAQKYDTLKDQEKARAQYAIANGTNPRTVNRVLQHALDLLEQAEQKEREAAIHKLEQQPDPPAIVSTDGKATDDSNDILLIPEFEIDLPTGFDSVALGDHQMGEGSFGYVRSEPGPLIGDKAFRARGFTRRRYSHSFALIGDTILSVGNANCATRVGSYTDFDLSLSLQLSGHGCFGLSLGNGNAALAIQRHRNAIDQVWITNGSTIIYDGRVLIPDKTFLQLSYEKQNITLQLNGKEIYSGQMGNMKGNVFLARPANKTGTLDVSLDALFVSDLSLPNPAGT